MIKRSRTKDSRTRVGGAGSTGMDSLAFMGDCKSVASLLSDLIGLDSVLALDPTDLG